MQQRINQLTQELRRYKHQHEHDTNAVDKDSTRRHRRHDKGKKNTF